MTSRVHIPVEEAEDSAVLRDEVSFELLNGETDTMGAGRKGVMRSWHEHEGDEVQKDCQRNLTELQRKELSKQSGWGRRRSRGGGKRKKRIGRQQDGKAHARKFGAVPAAPQEQARSLFVSTKNTKSPAQGGRFHNQ